MKISYGILSPVKKDTPLQRIFRYNVSFNESINPEELFKPTLAQFNKLAVGRFFWFIMETANWKHYTGGGDIEKMTPLKKEDFINQSLEKLHNITHPDDLAQVFAFSQFWWNYFLSLPQERKPHVKMTLYFRLLNPERNYYWIMVQYTDVIVDSEGKIAYGLVLVTDISHIKKDGKPMMSILDTYEDSCQQFFCLDGRNLTGPDYLLPKLTSREIEVLQFLAIGYSSKQIASVLNLSIKTIDNHRQNMLHKTQSKSTAELVSYSIRMGYL